MPKPPSYDRMSALIDAAAGVMEETDLEQVLRRVVSEARAATGARYGALGVIGEHGVLSDFLFEGMSDDQASLVGHLPTGRGVLGTVIQLNKTIRLAKISDHPDATGFPDHHPPMSNFLGVPIAVGPTAFGNLYLTEKDGGFTDQDVVVVEALSRIAGSAVKTARLQERLRRVAVVEDRQRIARELHDSVIQELFAVGLGLQGVSQLVESPQAQETLLDAVDRLDDAVETLRNYIFQLRRTPDHRASLDERLQELVSRMGSAYPARVELELDIEVSPPVILEDEIVAMITECLSNALRHSAADRVFVTLHYESEGWTIRVADDGRGFDHRSTSTGMGLDNLRARLDRIGGHLVIDSTAEGTTVEVRIPQLVG